LSANPWRGGSALPWGTPCGGFSFLHFQGSAITSVKIDGVLHEFSTIPGVLEDVTDVILISRKSGLICTVKTRDCWSSRKRARVR